MVNISAICLRSPKVSKLLDPTLCLLLVCLLVPGREKLYFYNTEVGTSPFDKKERKIKLYWQKIFRNKSIVCMWRASHTQKSRRSYVWHNSLRKVINTQRAEEAPYCCMNLITYLNWKIKYLTLMSIHWIHLQKNSLFLQKELLLLFSKLIFFLSLCLL